MLYRPDKTETTAAKAMRLAWQWVKAERRKAEIFSAEVAEHMRQFPHRDREQAESYVNRWIYKRPSVMPFSVALKGAWVAVRVVPTVDPYAARRLAAECCDVESIRSEELARIAAEQAAA